MPERKHAKNTNKPKPLAPVIALRAMCLDAMLQLLPCDIQSVTQDLLQHSMRVSEKL
jgi:hypothetical protein